MPSKFTGYIRALKGEPPRFAPIHLHPIVKPIKPRQFPANFLELQRARRHHRYFRDEHGREFPAWLAVQANKPQQRKQSKTYRRVAA